MNMASQRETTEQRSSKTFRFLSLPAEMRNMIYKLLVAPSKIPLPISHTFERAIVLINHQVNAEFLAIFYDIVSLRFYISNGLSVFYVADYVGKVLQSLPSQRVKRCKINVEANQGSRKSFSQSFERVTPDPRGIMVAGDVGRLRDHVDALVTALKAMRPLQVLDMSFISGIDHTQDIRRFCPENILESFTDLKGLRKVILKGDLSKEYAAYLEASMKAPPTTLSGEIKEADDSARG